MPSNSAGRVRAHLLGDDRAPIAALRHELRVPEALHQHDPGTRDVLGIPAGGGRLAREAVAGHRRNHQVERVRCAAAMCGGIGERFDDLHLLDDRSGPSVRDDERQRVLVLRANVDEVNVEAVDLGDEVRHGVQFRLDLAPVVVGRPVARECLSRGELNALRVVRDRFALRPPRRVDAAAQFGEIRLRKIHMEWTDGNSVAACLLRNLTHGVTPF